MLRDTPTREGTSRRNVLIAIAAGGIVAGFALWRMRRPNPELLGVRGTAMYRAILVGLNGVDPSRYAGHWPGSLNAAEKDAQHIERLLRDSIPDSQLQVASLRGKAATATAVLDALTSAARDLSDGDHLLFFYSGHGGQIPNVNHDEKVPDDTLCLYDRMLIDDELGEAWTRFAPGVSILALADSCHSGTVEHLEVEFAGDEGPFKHHNSPSAPTTAPAERFIPKLIPRDFAYATYEQDKGMYDGIQARIGGVLAGAPFKIVATLLGVSACKDEQLAVEGTNAGVFTSIVLNTWQKGAFHGSHRAFYDRLVAAAPTSQVPQWELLGAGDQAVWYHTRPFTFESLT